MRLGQAEIWKRVNGFPQYEVSNMGQVRSYHSGVSHVLSPGLCGPGYKYRSVTLFNNGHKVSRKISVLVAEHFIGPRPTGMDVSHLNENSFDDRACNLCYESRRGNNNRPLHKIRNAQAQRVGLTGYRGVQTTQSGKYKGYIRIWGRTVALGTFPMAEDAARAFDAKAIELRGADAVTNQSLGLISVVEVEK